MASSAFQRRISNRRIDSSAGNPRHLLSPDWADENSDLGHGGPLPESTGWLTRVPAGQRHSSRVTRQLLSLQATYGNQAVQRLLTPKHEDDGRPLQVSTVSPRDVVQRQEEPTSTNALAVRPKGLIGRLIARVKRSLAAKLLAAWLEARGAKFEVKDGRLVRTTRKQQVEQATQGTKSPKPSPGTGMPGTGVKGGPRVINAIGIISLADEIHNLGNKRIEVELEGLTPTEFPVGHEFKDVSLGDGVYIDIRVGTNIVGRRRFYIVKLHMGAA